MVDSILHKVFVLTERLQNDPEETAKQRNRPNDKPKQS